MSFLDSLILIVITVFVITGAYQIYLLPQNFPNRKARQMSLSFDEKIPFKPVWVWVYTLVYYPFFFSVIFTLDSFRHYAYVILSFTFLLLLQTAIAFLVPVKTPDNWRAYDPENSLSEKFLSILQSVDRGGNCFPSMHVAIVSLSVCHIWANAGDHLGIWFVFVFLVALLICASTVFTKQHFVLDIPAGAVLGGFVYWLFVLIY
ncbi:MAG: phosphatase PAP2 family protein [Hyphomicrobiales bacterium]